jgi:heme/copper-type cytochrome/quinol oxidase subunit 2
MTRKIFLPVSFVILWIHSYSQAPGHVPYGEPEPVEFDLFNIILLIVTPVILIIIYILFQRKKNKKKRK